MMVEINLSSNEGILGVEGDAHPFPVYRSAHVPVALSTDDEGVSRIDLTHEYVRAAHRLRPDLPRPEATGAHRNGARLSARREPVGKARRFSRGSRALQGRNSRRRQSFGRLQDSSSMAARRPPRSGNWSAASGSSRPNSRGRASTASCTDNNRCRTGCRALELLASKISPWTTSASAKSAWRCRTPGKRVNWGHHLVYWAGDRDIGGKMFAMTDLDGTGTGVLWFHCGAERFHELLESEGIFASPYLAKAYWVTLERWDALRPREIEEELQARACADLRKASRPHQSRSRYAGKGKKQGHPASARNRWAKEPEQSANRLNKLPLVPRLLRF